MKPRVPEETLRCSFCQKSQDAVAKLISASKRHSLAYICDECVAACNSILQQDARSGESMPKKTGWFKRVKSWWTYGIIGDVLSKL